MFEHTGLSGSRTRGLCSTELLEVTVCSPSCIMTISPLSSEPSARLFTEELWELALMDMDGSEWELSMLFTVPVRSMYCSTSYRHQRALNTNETEPEITSATEHDVCFIDTTKTDPMMLFINSKNLHHKQLGQKQSPSLHWIVQSVLNEGSMNSVFSGLLFNVQIKLY